MYASTRGGNIADMPIYKKIIEICYLPQQYRVCPGGEDVPDGGTNLKSFRVIDSLHRSNVVPFDISSIC